MRSPDPRRLVVGVALVLALVSVGGCVAAAPSPSIVMLSPNGTRAAMGVRDTIYNPPRPAPALQLTDQDGKPFDLAALRGTPVFVYFGYTHCPDVCPTTLADLRDAIQVANLPAKVVFVTVDPGRDTPPKMKEYVNAYSAGFIGLTGTAQQIATAAAAWGVRYQPGPVDSLGNYPMSHTTEVYLVDPSGTLRNHIFFGAQSGLIAELLRKVSG
ncbi:MAG TPA: SCO family protein [Candidatus Limnocylindrales bacterium]